ncbi:hypothetical protein BDF22DRAFT_651884 [Syncephalis plumigaleata]|nr:hypothetical protein BDF22DRAFT_651884 [Syncephalis plumigaleata]
MTNSLTTACYQSVLNYKLYEKRVTATATAVTVSQQSSSQSSSQSEPLSLLERRLSGRTGSSGVTFIDKRIELTRGLSVPNARAPRTPYPDTLPITPATAGSTSTHYTATTSEEGILDRAGAALELSSPLSNEVATAPIDDGASSTSRRSSTSMTSTSRTNGKKNTPGQNRSSARFAWMADWRRIIGVTSIVIIMVAMAVTSAKVQE